LNGRERHDVQVDERDQVARRWQVTSGRRVSLAAARRRHAVRAGLNYADHASELEFKPPTEPLVFIKAPNTFIGHNESVRPDNVEYMHYEAELVVVIGKTARRREADAMDYVAGYTVCNDYAIRDYLENYYRPTCGSKAATPDADRPVDRRKEAIPIRITALRTWVNGELRQRAPPPI
jgi:5-oxopent-3-ene-1,2,5-tricarboxylate decarboxylase/2-hydroxyhepta-2,4-diene-1,7-dioate isomerase